MSTMIAADTDPAARDGRYSRQVVLPGFGPDGQQRLARGRVALYGDPTVVRAAGLYLAAAGLGELVLSRTSLVEELEPLNDLVQVRPAEAGPAAEAAWERTGRAVARSADLPESLWVAWTGEQVVLGRGGHTPPERSPAAGGAGCSAAGIGEVIAGCRLAAAVLLALVRDDAEDKVRPAGVESSVWDLGGFGAAGVGDEEVGVAGEGSPGRFRAPDGEVPRRHGKPRPREGHAMLIGAGGLGSGVALGLACAHAAGVLGAGFRLTVIDPDVVEESNLPRQVLHRAQDLGRPKVRSAADAVHRIAPQMAVGGRPVRVGRENARGLLAGTDVVISAVDNFPTRYLLTDECVSLGVPLVEAGVLRFSGLVMLADPPRGPCYRCLFPVPPAPGSTPDPAAAGVLGPLAGLAGALEALLAVTVLCGDAARVRGKLLLLDARGDSMRVASLDRDPSCPACGAPGGAPLA